jgi:hypothetical protein
LRRVNWYSAHVYLNQGFGLSFGSDFYLAISKYGRNNLAQTAALESLFLHGNFSSANQSAEVLDLPGTFMLLDATTTNPYVVKGASPRYVLMT